MSDDPTPPARVPRLPALLGAAGLLPQAACLAVAWLGERSAAGAAALLAWAYAAAILSFLGGTWWGLGAARADRAPPWLWFAAVAPSLLAVGTLLVAPLLARSFDAVARAGLLAVAMALLIALTADAALVRRGFAPPWWLRLRLPLSLGLSLLTAAVALLAPR